jgi:hypothetical protein
LGKNGASEQTYRPKCRHSSFKSERNAPKRSFSS